MGAQEPKFGEPEVFVESHHILDDLAWKRDPRVKLTADADRLLRTELARVTKIVERTRWLDGIAEGRFPVEYKVVWPTTLVPDLVKSRRLATVLQFHALYNAHHQRWPDEASRDAYQCAQIARFYGDEYTLITQLLRIATMSVAVQCTELALSSGEPSTKSLARLEEVFAAEDRELPGLVRNAARAERTLTHRMMLAVCNGQVKLDDLGRGFWHPDNFFDEVGMYFGTTPLRYQHAAFLRTMTGAIEQSKPAADNPNAWYERHAGGVAKVYGAQIRTQAYLRCAFTALATERYRQEKGHWPESLQQLVPGYLKEVPTDPFDKDKHPVRLARNEDRIVIYSVGVGGTDHGGLIDWHDRFQPASDLGFCVWNKDQRTLQEPD